MPSWNLRTLPQMLKPVSSGAGAGAGRTGGRIRSRQTLEEAGGPSAEPPEGARTRRHPNCALGPQSCLLRRPRETQPSRVRQREDGPGPP